MIQEIKLNVFTATAMHLAAHSVSEDDGDFFARTDSSGGGTEERCH